MSDKIWLHYSDCAVHNEPAYPAGPCSCSRPAEIATCTSCGDHSPLVQRLNAEVERLTREQLAAAQAREQACTERIKDALDCLPRALDGSRPFSLDQRAEVMLAIEALRAALAAAGGDGK